MDSPYRQRIFRDSCEKVFGSRMLHRTGNFAGLASSAPFDINKDLFHTLYLPNVLSLFDVCPVNQGCG